MDLTAFSTVPSVLGILVPTFALLGFGWLWWRTESRHVLMYRIWRLLHGSQLFADVSLTAEPFFRKSGFVVEARQLVEVRGVLLANARMGKELPTLNS